MLYVLHAISVLLGIAGATLVAFRRPRIGQALWIPANALLIVWCADHGDAWGMTLFAVYLLVSIIGVEKARNTKL